MITLMKIGPYNSIKKGLTKYESIKLLTLNKFDTEIDQEQMKKYIQHDKFFLKFDCIVVSKFNRAQSTLKYLLDNDLLKNNIVIKSSSNLDEILFDSGLLCTEKEYTRFGSNIIRKRFLDFFVNDNLTETLEQIKSRIDNLEKDLNVLDRKYKNILCISHTFFIKLVLIYKKNRNLFSEPHIIKNNINPNKRIMEFCEINNIF
jgi:broad specificity phosphatase PhoE